MKTRSLMKASLALALAAVMVTASLGAEITPDMDPTPGPGKITSTGKWKVDVGETADFIRIIATPTGGGGGVGGSARVANPVGATYTVTIEDLAANTEYDVIIFLEYTAAGKSQAVFTKTYKVKTK